MTDERHASKRIRLSWKTVILVTLAILFLGSAVVYAVQMKRSTGRTPKLVNRATAAREVKPLTTKADKRFAPLPIEREKHSQ